MNAQELVSSIAEETSHELIRIAEETRQSLVANRGYYISNDGQVFTLPDSTVLAEIKCIVLDFVRANVLLPPYNPKVRANPLCWAIGRNDTQLAPGTDVPNPVTPTCAECENNKFGSASGGRGGKACSNRYRLAIVPPNATADADIWLLNIPPTSLRAWTAYVQKAEITQGAAGFCRVITKVTMDPNTKYPKLLFRAISPVTDPTVALTLRPYAREVLFASPGGGD